MIKARALLPNLMDKRIRVRFLVNGYWHEQALKAAANTINCA
jgi:hypothetical protein